jgi:hypothetical protein
VVNIIENRAKVEGTVKSVSENKGPDGYMQVEVDLKRSSDVEGYPNLAKADVGSKITVNVKKDDIAPHSFRPGKQFSSEVRKAFGQVYFLQS